MQEAGLTHSLWADETKPIPRPVWVRFVCDGDHGLLPPVEQTFALGPETPNAWTQAVAAGWLIVPERDLCPECRK